MGAGQVSGSGLCVWVWEDPSGWKEASCLTTHHAQVLGQAGGDQASHCPEAGGQLWPHSWRNNFWNVFGYFYYHILVFLILPLHSPWGLRGEIVSVCRECVAANWMYMRPLGFLTQSSLVFLPLCKKIQSPQGIRESKSSRTLPPIGYALCAIFCTFSTQTLTPARTHRHTW